MRPKPDSYAHAASVLNSLCLQWYYLSGLFFKAAQGTVSTRDAGAIVDGDARILGKICNHHYLYCMQGSHCGVLEEHRFPRSSAGAS